MKKWDDYSKQERGMFIMVIIMLIAIILSWGRVKEGVLKGISYYDGTPDTEQTK